MEDSTKGNGSRGKGRVRRSPLFQFISSKQLWLGLGLSAVLASCGSAAQTTSSTATPAPKPPINIGYFSGGVGAPETIIGSDPALASSVSAKLHFTPITAGLAALSEMRAGAFDMVSEVGNPPVVSAVAGGTNLRVIWVQSYDGAALIVHSGITKASQLSGSTIGDLEGSSEDFELRGYLKETNMTSKTTVLGFPSDAAAGAAWLSGKIQAAYVTIDVADELLAHGGHSITTAAAIAKQGYPSLNVLVAGQSLITAHPQAVQSYICAEMKATNILTTGSAEAKKKAITAAAKLQGVPPAEAVTATEQWPNIPVSQERSWLTAPPGGQNPVTKAYELTAAFLKAQGTLANPPSNQVLSGLVDPTFALNALAGKC